MSYNRLKEAAGKYRRNIKPIHCTVVKITRKSASAFQKAGLERKLMLPDELSVNSLRTAIAKLYGLNANNKITLYRKLSGLELDEEDVKAIGLSTTIYCFMEELEAVYGSRKTNDVKERPSKATATDTSACPKCGDGEETVSHFLGQCPAIAQIRGSGLVVESTFKPKRMRSKSMNLPEEPSGSQMVMSSFKPKRCRFRTADILAAGAPGATTGIGHHCTVEEYSLERREFMKTEGRLEITDVSLGRGGYRRVSKGRLLRGEDIMDVAVKLFHEQGIERIRNGGLTVEEESRRYVKCLEVAHALALEFAKATGEPLGYNKGMLVTSEEKVFMVEPMLNGQPWKLVNNDGKSCGNPEQVPIPKETVEAFVHFTYHATEGALLVLDIQGMGTSLMDPEISTSGQIDPLEEYFNVGNFGQDGIKNFFEWHICNDICKDYKAFK
ncbi:uncharacterized protein LOC134825856 [Bolinopsis microptera]